LESDSESEHLIQPNIRTDSNAALITK